MTLRLKSAAGRGVLAATVLGSGVAFLDGTVINVALPTLGRELGGGLAGLQWTVDAYLVTLGALVLSGGSLGDLLGRRKIFVAGLAGFSAASVLCALAGRIELLIAARALQGVAAALLVPGSLAILRASIAEEDQGAAIGAWAGLSGVTTAIGPLLGGWLVALHWSLIFLVNLPLAGLAAWAALKYVPESKSEDARLDLPGSFTAALGLGGVVFALIEGPARGYFSAPVLVAFVGGALLLAAFFVVESRAAAPMLPLRIFRSRSFSGANATTLAVYFGFGAGFFLLGLQLQETLHYSPLAAGAAFVPATLLMLALSSFAGRVASRIGPRWPMTVGPLCAALGLLLGARASEGATYLGTVFPSVFVLGLGLAATVAPLTSAALSGVAPELAGVASGVNNAIARIAGLLAVALVPLASGMASGASLAESFPRGMCISAAVCAAGGLCAWATLPHGPLATPGEAAPGKDAPPP